jgi:hypothetical protein
MIRIRTFCPVDEEAVCLEYIEGHRMVLEDYGILNVTSYNKDWISNPHAYGVIAEVDGMLVGGIRVEVADGIHRLPVETAVGKIDPKVFDLVRKHRLNGGTGELCGLWNSKKVAGQGISVLLVRAAISVINQLKFRTLLGICAEYSLPMFSRVGFIIDTSLGDHGNFEYPTSEYQANVVGILNAENLSTSTPFDRERMLYLRANPKMLITETGPKGEIVIDYNLLIPHIRPVENREEVENKPNQNRSSNL